MALAVCGADLKDFGDGQVFFRDPPADMHEGCGRHPISRDRELPNTAGFHHQNEQVLPFRFRGPARVIKRGGGYRVSYFYCWVVGLLGRWSCGGVCGGIRGAMPFVCFQWLTVIYLCILVSIRRNLWFRVTPTFCVSGLFRLALDGLRVLVVQVLFDIPRLAQQAALRGPSVLGEGEEVVERRPDAGLPEPGRNPRRAGHLARLAGDRAARRGPHGHQDVEVCADLIGFEHGGIALEGIDPQRQGPLRA